MQCGLMPCFKLSCHTFCASEQFVTGSENSIQPLSWRMVHHFTNANKLSRLKKPVVRQSRVAIFTGICNTTQIHWYKQDIENYYNYNVCYYFWTSEVNKVAKTSFPVPLNPPPTSSFLKETEVRYCLWRGYDLEKHESTWTQVAANSLLQELLFFWHVLLL